MYRKWTVLPEYPKTLSTDDGGGAKPTSEAFGEATKSRSGESNRMKSTDSLPDNPSTDSLNVPTPLRTASSGSSSRKQSEYPKLEPLGVSGGTAGFYRLMERPKVWTDCDLARDVENLAKPECFWVFKALEHAREEAAFYDLLRKDITVDCEYLLMSKKRRRKGKDRNSRSPRSNVRAPSENKRSRSPRDKSGEHLSRQCKRRLQFYESCFCVCPGVAIVVEENRAGESNDTSNFLATHVSSGELPRLTAGPADMVGKSTSVPDHWNLYEDSHSNLNNLDMGTELDGTKGNGAKTKGVRSFLVLSNMYEGFRKLRFADLKIGKQTAVANWMGKSAFRAWRNHQIDRMTNSTTEGFRVEGLENAPDGLSDYTAVAASSMLASLVKKQKLKRITLQRLNALEFWRLFLEYDRTMVVKSSNDPAGHASHVPAMPGTVGESPNTIHLESKKPFKGVLSSGRNKELYSRYVLLAIIVKLTKLVQNLCQVEVPQMWVGSSLGVGFELNFELQLDSTAEELRQEGDANTRSHPGRRDSEGRFNSSKIKEPFIKLFDWGRSEWNTAAEHAKRTPDEKLTRVSHWRGYLQSLIWILYQSSRLFLHRFATPKWRTLVVQIEEFHSMHRNVAKAAAEIPLFPSGVTVGYYGVSEEHALADIIHTNNTSFNTASNAGTTSHENFKSDSKAKGTSPICMLKTGKIYTIPLKSLPSVWLGEEANSCHNSPTVARQRSRSDREKSDHGRRDPARKHSRSRKSSRNRRGSRSQSRKRSANRKPTDSRKQNSSTDGLGEHNDKDNMYASSALPGSDSDPDSRRGKHTSKEKDGQQSRDRQHSKDSEDGILGNVRLRFRKLSLQRISVEILGFHSNDKKFSSGNFNIALSCFEESRDGFAYLYNTFCRSDSDYEQLPFRGKAATHSSRLLVKKDLLSKINSKERCRSTQRTSRMDPVDKVSASGNVTSGVRRVTARSLSPTIGRMSLAKKNRGTSLRDGSAIPLPCSSLPQNSRDLGTLSEAAYDTTTEDANSTAVDYDGVIKNKTKLNRTISNCAISGTSPDHLAERSPHLTARSPDLNEASDLVKEHTENDGSAKTGGVSPFHTTTYIHNYCFTKPASSQDKSDGSKMDAISDLRMTKIEKSFYNGASNDGENGLGRAANRELRRTFAREKQNEIAECFEFLGSSHGEEHLVTALNLPPEILLLSRNSVSTKRTSPLLKVFPCPNLIEDQSEEVSVSSRWFGRQVTARYFHPDFLYDAKHIPKGWL